MVSFMSDLPRSDEEELLLIISGMGEHVEAEGRYMVGPECKDCVADLQRYLRRDDPMVMAAHRALGQWRVLQTHLLPLLQANGDSDSRLTFSVLKVIVKLTMKPEQLGAPRPHLLATACTACTCMLPLSCVDLTLCVSPAARMRDSLEEKKSPDPLIGARIDDLQRHHLAYKKAFVHGDAVGMLVSLLGRALSVPDAMRSEDDGMVIELLLALILSERPRPRQHASQLPNAQREV